MFLWDYLSLTCFSLIPPRLQQKFNVVFSLSYRLTPSIPFTSRTLDKDTVLGDYTLPKGVSVLWVFSSLCCHWSEMCLTLIFMFSDGSDDQQSGFGFQRGVFWQRKAVQTRALASQEELHQPVRSRALRDRKENVHRPASCRATDPVGLVLGTFTFQCRQIWTLSVKSRGSLFTLCIFSQILRDYEIVATDHEPVEAWHSGTLVPSRELPVAFIPRWGNKIKLTLFKCFIEFHLVFCCFYQIKFILYFSNLFFVFTDNIPI